MKNFRLLFLLLPFLSSCANKDANTDVDTFDIVENITRYDSIFSDKQFPLGPVTDLRISHNVLVLAHMNDEFRFSFIDVADKKLLCRWGTTGNGPEEFIDFGSDFYIRDSLLVFSTFARKEINYVNLNDILNQRPVIGIRTEKYPYAVDFRPRRICPVNDKKIVVGSLENNLFGIVDSNDKIIEHTFDYPFSYEEIDGIFKGNVFQSFIAANSKENRFVLSILASDIFEIFQITGDKVSNLYISPFKHVPSIKEKGGRYTIDYEKSTAGLMKLAVSDRFICFTYSSQSYEMAAGNEKASNELLCFDWNGNKVKKYILPFPVTNICLSDDFIYGIRYFEDETVVYRFKL